MKIALLTPGRETDHGWNQLAFEALQQVAERDGAAVKHTHTPNRATFKAEMRDFAQLGYTLVVCHGGEYVKAAREVAREFPDTHFVVTGSADSGAGVATIDFRLWQATYLCGVLAADLFPLGPAGLIGGEDTTTVRNTLNAFANGAKSVSKLFVSHAQYVGSWDDVARAQQTAKSLIDARGVKILFQNTDAAAAGVFRAAGDAGILAFGSNSNQNDAAGKVVPASAVIRMDLAFELLIDRIQRKLLFDEVIVGDLGDGLVEIAINPAFEGRIPAKAIERIQYARQKIINGSLDPLVAP